MPVLPAAFVLMTVGARRSSSVVLCCATANFRQRFNTILQALDTFLPGRPNAGAVFPHIAGATHHVVASNAILAEWLNYTNLERQEARAFYAWGRGNMF